MNVADKFNKVFDEIEAMASSDTLIASDIAQIVAKNSGQSFRDMSTVFSFFTGKTLNAYVTERKLAASYLCLVKTGNVLEAVGIAGYSDQPSFSKAFKKLFGLTPREAAKGKDLSRVPPPLTWDMLSGRSASAIPITEDVEDMEEKVFGVSASILEKIIKALNLEAFYGFSRMFSIYAFNLSESTGHTLEDCFRYADSLREFGREYDDGHNDESDDEYDIIMTPAERLHKWGDDEFIQQLFFTRGISVEVSHEILDLYCGKPKDMLSYDPEMLTRFLDYKEDEHIDMALSFFARAFYYYTQRLDIDKTEDYFEEYIDLLLRGYPIEEAFKEVFFEISVNQAQEEDLSRGTVDISNIMDSEFDEYEGIEALAEEEEQWYGKRIDDDLRYDPDNPVYS